MDRRPAMIAAVANSLIVLFGPIFVYAIVRVFSTPSNTSVTVRAPGAPSFDSLSAASSPILFTIALALLAGWRTRVHAERRLLQNAKDCRGIAEAAVCGLALALAVLAPGILTRPWDAPAYVITYGAMGMVFGLVVGAVLHAVATVILRFTTPSHGPHSWLR